MPIGTTELIVIALIIVLLFGARKIPDLMKGLGSGIKEFKKASSIDNDDDRERERLRVEREQREREQRELPR